MARQATIKTTTTTMTTSSQTTPSTLLAAATNSMLASLQHYNKTTTLELSEWATTDSCNQTIVHQDHNEQLGGKTNATSANNEDQDEQLYVKLSTFWYCFFAFVTAVGLLVSLVSNMIIIYLFTGTPSSRRNPSNIIAVNLSLSDLLYCIQWPSVIYCSLSQSTWMLEIDFVCKTFGFITVTTASASVLTVLAMSVERAIVIKYSIYAKSRYTIRSAWLIVVLIWIVSIGSSLPPLFDRFNRFTLDPSKTSCTLDYLSGKTNFKLYMLVIYIVYWIVPATIISICYIFIIMTFRRSSRNLKQVALSSSSPSWASSEFSGRFEPTSSRPGSNNQATHSQQPQSMMQASSWSLRSHSRPVGSGGRDRLRDSIRLSNFLGNLRRASTTRLAARDISLDGQHHGPATSNRMPLEGNRPDPILKRVASVYQQRLARRTAPRTKSDQALERIGLASIARSRGSNELKIAPGREQSQVVGDYDEMLQGVPEQSTGHRQLRPSDEASPRDSLASRSAPTAANPICGPNERALGRGPSSWLRRKFPALARPPLPPLPPGERQIPLDAATGCWQDRAHGGPGLADLATAITTTKQLLQPSPIQRPLGGHHRLVGSSNATINSEPNPFSATRQPVQGRALKLAFISRVASQLNGAAHDDDNDGGGRAFAATNRPMRVRSCSKTYCAPTPPETTCHFGNSSSQLSRARMQIRLARMSFYLVLLWLISWTPIASLTLINLIVKCHLRANALMVFLANTMTKLGPTFDVFIYGISHPKIKRKFIQIIKKLLMLEAGNDAGGSGSRRNTGLSVATTNLRATINQQRLVQRTMTLNEDRLSARTTRSNWETLLRSRA